MLKKRMVIWALWLIFCPILFAEPRLWTHQDGRTAVAEFVALNGEIVELKERHRTIRLPLASLSTQDQDHIRTRLEEAEKMEEAFSSAPLQIFEREDYKGQKGGLDPQRIYSGGGSVSGGSEIPNGLNNRVSSLILKKGYQVCIATTPDGVGPSKVLIANKRDIRIPKLSNKFNDRIQYIRVLPFRNVVKKGFAGRTGFQGLDQGWFYTWGGFHEAAMATENILWSPQIFGASMAKDETVQKLIKIKGIQDVMAYNEPSMKMGVNNPETAVSLYKKFMGTGLRLGSVSPTEGGPLNSYAGYVEGKKSQKKSGWYRGWHDEAIEQGLRQDFMCVHWYDWGGSYGDPGKASAKAVFARFKRYLQEVHEQYDLPIWITEFNANPHCPPETHLEFAELAFPYLDSCPYIERYAWFQPFNYDAMEKGDDGEFKTTDIELRNKGSANYRRIHNDPNSPLTRFGKFAARHKSVPAMDEEVYLGKNNLFKDEVEEK